MAQPAFTLWAYLAPVGQQGGIVEPDLAKKQIGWQPGEQPACESMNWIQNQEYLWQLFVESKTETIDRIYIPPVSATWNNGTLTFASPIKISFRVKTGEQVNQFPAGTLSLTDGQVVVFRKDKTNSSPVNLASGNYGTGLNAGQYAIIAESSLTAANQENEVVLFRRRGTNFEIPCMGTYFPNNTTFTFGNPLTNNGAITIDASQVTSGTFADARIAQSNVTQHQSALALAASQITSGTFADARIAQSNVTQHQAALALAASQITSGTLPVARGGTGVTSSTGSTSVVLSDSPTIVTPTIASLINMQHNHQNAAGGGALSTAAITSGTFADARIAQSNVTQHQAALALAASQITSGTFADARIAQSNVTQHQAALSIAETQIPDGSIFARVGSPETITQFWNHQAAIGLLDSDPPGSNIVLAKSVSNGWVAFDSAGSIDQSFNVSSVSHPSTGNYTVNWNSAFPNNDYAIVTGAQDVQDASWGGKFTDHVTIVVRNKTDASLSNDRVDVVSFGLK